VNIVLTEKIYRKWSSCKQSYCYPAFKEINRFSKMSKKEITLKDHTEAMSCMCCVRWKDF